MGRSNPPEADGGSLEVQTGQSKRSVGLDEYLVMARLLSFYIFCPLQGIIRTCVELPTDGSVV